MYLSLAPLEYKGNDIASMITSSILFIHMANDVLESIPQNISLAGILVTLQLFQQQPSVTICCAGLLSEGRVEPGTVPGRPRSQQPPLCCWGTAQRLSRFYTELGMSCFFGERVLDRVLERQQLGCGELGLNYV